MTESTQSAEWTDLPPSRKLAAPPRILIVDDEEDFLELASTLLREAGYEVHCARAAGEAVARAVLTAPDVILLDILLPGTDGLDILETLRDEPETPDAVELACTETVQQPSGTL